MTDLSQWTVEDKARMLSGANMWHLKDVPQRNLPRVMITDGPHGLRKQGDGGGMQGVPATCFPTAVGLAATWDEDLLREVGAAIALESRKEDVVVLLGPGANIKRHPLCGRNFEYFSEDPLLSGRLAAAFIDGVQTQGVGTSIKHYAANNQESNRMVLDTLVDERTLREVYLAGFEHAITQSQPWTVMCAYNLINGVYCAENPWLLTTVLRDEWGFDGLVMTDWGATNERPKGVAAGLDLEMPGSGGRNDELVVAAVAAGELDEAAVDVVAGRVLNLIERSIRDLPPVAAPDFDAHHELAAQAAAASQVLLTNDGLLPLEPSASVAVIGEFATRPRYQGAGSSQVTPTRTDTLLDAVTALVSDPNQVTHARGYRIHSDEPRPDLLEEAVAAAANADVAIVAVGLPPSYESEGFDREHMRLPRQHDQLVRAVVAANPNTVVVLSNGSSVEMPWVGEPRAILEGFLGGQASGTGTARVLYGEVNPSGKLAETFAVSQADHGADLNFGQSVGRQIQYREGVFVGYRWFDTLGIEPLFPFGHGLSYTTFGYGDLHVAGNTDADAEDFSVSVSVDVTNTGAVTGAEVVQLYVRDSVASVARPDRELKDFARVVLQPGATQTVSFSLDRRAFAFWADNGWRVESGEFEILVGSSSRDIRGSGQLNLTAEHHTSEPAVPPTVADLHDLASFEARLGQPVPAVTPVLPFTRNSTLDDISMTGLGRALRKQVVKQLTRSFGGSDAKPTGEAYALVNGIVGGMPLRAMLLLSEGKLTWPMVDRLVAVLNRLPKRS